LFSFISYTIPTIGVYLVAIPTLLVAFSISATTGIEVLVLVTVCGIIEGFFITPAVMGPQMYIHPLTILILIYVASTLFGLLGLLFIIPIYAVFKVTLRYREMLVKIFSFSNTTT
jgi:predicted PurR-regulated permease PerM